MENIGFVFEWFNGKIILIAMKNICPIFAKFLLVILSVALFLVFVNQLQAAMEFKVEGIENNPAEINYDQSIEILFSFSGVSSPKTYYLAGVFQKEAGSNYFGYTWNNNWYKYGDDFTNFYKLEINESSYSGKLKIKPDIDSSGFKGTGDYLLKMYRYCSSQNSCGDTNTLTIKIISPPSPSPTPSPSPAASPSPSPSPTPSPSPSLSRSPSPSPKLLKSPSPIPTEEPTGSDPVGEATTAGEVLGEKKKNPFTLSFILIGLGITLLATTGIVFYNQRHERKN
ncbi:MAG: hypothetical protein U0946_02545 [Patescibacteria group bacterium]|nr:hypothetical protein [Patescibacteria group bacterium]